MDTLVFRRSTLGRSLNDSDRWCLAQKDLGRSLLGAGPPINFLRYGGINYLLIHRRNFKRLSLHPSLQHSREPLMSCRTKCTFPVNKLLVIYLLILTQRGSHEAVSCSAGSPRHAEGEAPTERTCISPATRCFPILCAPGSYLRPRRDLGVHQPFKGLDARNVHTVDNFDQLI